MQLLAREQIRIENYFYSKNSRDYNSSETIFTLHKHVLWKLMYINHVWNSNKRNWVIKVYLVSTFGPLIGGSCVWRRLPGENGIVMGQVWPGVTHSLSPGHCQHIGLSRGLSKISSCRIAGWINPSRNGVCYSTFNFHIMVYEHPLFFRGWVFNLSSMSYFFLICLTVWMTFLVTPYWTLLALTQL